MSGSNSGDVTNLLARAADGEVNAPGELFEIVENELRQIASGYLRREQPGHTLQATLLVDDAFLQIVGDRNPVPWQSRTHFYRVAARVMRRILVDHERARRAQKRGGQEMRRVNVDLDRLGNEQTRWDVLALDEALDSLAKFDARQADVVELRHFGGYTVEETANLLGISPTTVKTEFATAKIWLYRELTRDGVDT